MRQQLAMLMAQNLDLNRSRAALEAVNGGLERDNARLKSRCLATEQVLRAVSLWGLRGSGLFALCRLLQCPGEVAGNPWAAVSMTCVLPSASRHVDVVHEGMCLGLSAMIISQHVQGHCRHASWPSVSPINACSCPCCCEAAARFAASCFLI